MKVQIITTLLLMVLLPMRLLGTDNAIAGKSEDAWSHPLIFLIEQNGSMLGGFALNAKLGSLTYDTCPLAVSFYREGVAWKITDKYGEEELLNYYPKMHMDDGDIVKILMVLNAMEFSKKRDLLIKWRDLVRANYESWNYKDICPRRTKENKWEWVEMTLGEFFEEVISRTPARER